MQDDVKIKKTNVNYKITNRIVSSIQQDYEFPSTVPLESATHGGDDVGVYASGPWSHLFSGVYEQNFIPHAMSYAACIGNGIMACNE